MGDELHIDQDRSRADVGFLTSAIPHPPSARQRLSQTTANITFTTDLLIFASPGVSGSPQGVLGGQRSLNEPDGSIPSRARVAFRSTLRQTAP
jgi:hypothetical protein